MKTQEDLLADTSHRQLPLPGAQWQSYREWHNVVMLHWRVPVQSVVALIPAGLTLDTFEGEAWVSWMAFTVKGLRHRGFAQLPFLSGFEEVNLRTYVVRDGRPGVYLLSVEANKFFLLFLTRLVTGIPYIKSDIRREPGFIGLSNRAHHFNAHINFAYTEPLSNKPPLDCWLTERDYLYVNATDKLYRHDLHYKEKKLSGLIVSANSLKYAIGDLTIGKKAPDKKHFAKKLKVLIGKGHQLP